MSVEVLENLKSQAEEKLSPRERRLLAQHLVESAERAEGIDLGFSAESREEKRRLRNEWMKSEANRKQYGGFYVALDGDKVVATGKNYPEATRAAKDAGIEDFVVDVVLPPEYVGEIGGWE